jgi:hypothetical protein
MSSDPNKKSARNFQCRDILWDAFQQMAQELECSVDYLINEAMKQYARQRYAGRTGQRQESNNSASTNNEPAAAPPAPPLPGSMRPSALPVSSSPVPPPPARPRGPSAVPPPPPAAARPGLVGTPPPFHRTMPPAPPPAAPAIAAGMAAASNAIPHAASAAASLVGTGRTVPPPLPGARNMPPPPPMPVAARYGGPAVPAPAPSYAGQLMVLYGGERLPVNKDRFIIGRGRQSSDLTIKDPNVSRQHAMIEFLNGQYYMVDMGSTNGVEYNGQRISRHPIAEGDVYRICDHEVRFTYR